ncbi:helix-turn-helix transcriptional regulator [Clostridium sp. C2-6-12]|uniref:helix-turn-helix transcriptional regulator n=1 Tax=Clostridium sp. C2-6-12 TaxID=2698832 RepID=UPI00136F1CBF|nr:helix-turn-helix transcriptional regulator [Clostridium sp. C2-6-12]
MSKKLGLKIKQLRSDYSFNTGIKLTQKDLADKLGLSRSYLGDIESGRTNASDEILHKLSEIFNINYSELLKFQQDDQIDTVSNKLDSENNTIDEGLVLIERARKKMNEKDKQKMLDILKVAFEEYFND